MMPWGASRCRSMALLVSVFGMLAQAITIDPGDENSIKNAAKSVATDMMGYYIGNQPGQTPGYLPGDGQQGGYYWWVGGGMFGTMVNYWYHTGDTTWNDETAQALYFQSDPSSGGYFASNNVSAQLGNDDQAFWGMAAMMAAEYKFQNPPSNYPSWLGMAQGVFNQQNARWDPATCNGGLRWQVFPFNAGYDYKNSISNGCFFNIAARLGKYTGNHTYTDAAIRTYDWSVAERLIIPEDNYKIIDGIIVENCTPNVTAHELQWTYNVGVYLYGAAAMWNITQNDAHYSSQAPLWHSRVLGLLNGTQIFLRTTPTGSRVLTEVICEPQNTCHTDQESFKAYLARWMRASAVVAPFIADQVADLLQPSIQAAAQACSGPGKNGGVACGEKWYTGSFDGKTGVGMDMNALEIWQTLLPKPGPVTFNSGGISQSDPSAGSSSQISIEAPTQSERIHIDKGDNAGAAILTILMAVVTLGGGFWIVKEPSEGERERIEGAFRRQMEEREKVREWGERKERFGGKTAEGVLAGDGDSVGTFEDGNGEKKRWKGKGKGGLNCM